MKASAELVVWVRDGAGAEKQARAFDGSGGEDEVFGGEAELSTSVVEDAGGFDAAIGAEESSDVGVGEDGDVGVGEDCGAESLRQVALVEGCPLGEAEGDVV